VTEVVFDPTTARNVRVVAGAGSANLAALCVRGTRGG
jgi:hypothetical protein